MHVDPKKTKRNLFAKLGAYAKAAKYQDGLDLDLERGWLAIILALLSR